MTLLELGDPELHMYNGNPRQLSVSAAGTYALGDTAYAVNVSSGGSPIANALVTAYKAGDDFRTGYTDASGAVTLPFRPASTGAFTLPVTPYNPHPFHPP